MAARYWLVAGPRDASGWRYNAGRFIPPPACADPVTRQSFTRSQRLLSEHQFQPVFQTPDYRVGEGPLLLLARENQLPVARLGLVVGRRRVRFAVRRNLIKRQARETFRAHQQALAGLDIILLVRQPWPRPERAVTRATLLALWDKLLAKRSQA